MKKKSSVCPHRQHISLGSKWVSQMQGKGKPLKSSLQVHMQGTAEIDMHLFLSGHQLLQTQSRDSIVANRTLTAGPHTAALLPSGTLLPKLWWRYSETKAITTGWRTVEGLPSHPIVCFPSLIVRVRDPTIFLGSREYSHPLYFFRVKLFYMFLIKM